MRRTPNEEIPTLFEREYAGHKVVGIKDTVTPGMEWVLDGEGEATVKIDGACCAIINDVFYRRYDAKKGKTPPPPQARSPAATRTP